MSEDNRLSISGNIIEILDVESGESKAGKEWRKQSFVVETSGDYAKTVCFSLFGDDKIEMLGKYVVGRHVEVLFNVSSREFNGKYYHNLDCWQIQSNDVSTNEVGADKEEDQVPF